MTYLQLIRLTLYNNTSWIASRQLVVELVWNRIPAAGIRILECYNPGCRYGK